jgi:hypothetical protein
MGFVVDKEVLRQVFSEYFGLPFPSSFHQITHTHLSSRPGTMGQYWPTYQVDCLSPTVCVKKITELKKRPGPNNGL